MKLLRPLTAGATGYGITSGMLTSSTIAEPAAGETVWNAGTNYATGAEVIRTGTHRVYRRLTPGGVSASVPESTPTEWEDIGPTKRWAMFDKVIGTTSELASGPLTVVLVPGEIVSSIALLGLVGNAVQVTVKDAPGGATVYNSGSIPLLLTDGIDDWYKYFFEPIESRLTVVLNDLPPYPSCEITVSITGSGAVGCGTCYLGNAFELGPAEFGASVGIIDYSSKDVDPTTGRVTVVEGAFRDRAQIRMQLPRDRVQALKRQFVAYRATPAIWAPDTGEDEALTVFGFYKDFSTVIAYPTVATCQLELEGLT